MLENGQISSAELAMEDPNFIDVFLTERACKFFNANTILFGVANMDPHPLIPVRIRKSGRLEQYILFSGLVSHEMGAFSYNHSQCTDIRAGRYCSIGDGLTVFGERHPVVWVTTSNITYCFRPDWNKPHFLRAHQELMGNRWAPLLPPSVRNDAPVLGHDVWVAQNVTLATGIVIGTGAVIGCNAVVTKDVEPYTIVVGNPARVVRRRFSDATCERLLASRWWNLHPDVLFLHDCDDPERFLDQVEEANRSSFVELSPVKSFSWCEVLDCIGNID